MKSKHKNNQESDSNRRTSKNWSAGILARFKKSEAKAQTTDPTIQKYGSIISNLTFSKKLHASPSDRYVIQSFPDTNSPEPPSIISPEPSSITSPEPSSTISPMPPSIMLPDVEVDTLSNMPKKKTKSSWTIFSVSSSEEGGSKSTISRPILNWLFKGTNTKAEHSNIVNPFFKFAAFAMNDQEHQEHQKNTNTEAVSTIHGIRSHGFKESSNKPCIPTLILPPDDPLPKLTLPRSDSVKSVFEQSIENNQPSFNGVEADVQSTSLSHTDNKIQMVFDLPMNEKYLKEFPCWLVMSVLLKGYIYVTEKHLCFHSSLPTVPGDTRKEGFLYVKSLTHTCWCVLKSDGLYIYQNNKQLYFPKITIDLQNITSIEPNQSTYSIKLFTTKKSYILKADTITQMNEWVDKITVAELSAKNSGTDDVRIVLPFLSISDLRIVNTSLNTQCIQISAALDDAYDSEEYFFSYFNDIEKAFSQLKNIWDESKISTINQGTNLLTVISTSINHLTLKKKSFSNIGRTGSFKEQPIESQKKETHSSEKSPVYSLSIRETHSLKRSPSIMSQTHSISSRKSGKKRDEMNEETCKSFFAINQSEQLFQSFSASLMKFMPLQGILYVFTNCIGFKTSKIGFKVQALISFSDIVKLDLKKSSTSNQALLVIITKNHDEILFTFSALEARDQCHALVNSKLEESFQSKSISHPRSAILNEIGHQEDHVNLAFSNDLLSKARPVGLARLKPPKTMHITCVTIGTRGDVQPYIALCQGLMKHGHTCRIATHDEYQNWIQGFGIEFRSVKGDPSQLMKLCVDYGMFTVGFIREGLNSFRGWIEELLESCYTACEGTELIIESPTAFGGIHVAEAMQVPYFSAFPFPWTKTKKFPHPFAVAERYMGGSYNYMSYVMIEQVLWMGLIVSINPWRRRLNLEPLSITVEDPKTPFLYSFSPSVVSQPSDWHDWIHLCGYWFLDNPDLNWKPPDTLLSWLRDGTKPVYIGFGSVIVQNADETTKIIVDAVIKSGVRAILCKGWSSRSKTGPEVEIKYPDSIYPMNSVPHDWLFPQLAGVVHHGGAGTTAAGLRAGCPTIIHPFFGDQFFWADRVTELGVGLCVRKLTTNRFATALTQITTDVKIQEKAHLLGEKIRSENGVATAIEYIYRDLDYAKERIQDLANVHNKHQVSP